MPALQDSSSLTTQILNSLVGGAASYVGGQAAAWILTSVLGTSGPTGSQLTDIQSDLNALNAQMNAVIQELLNIEQQLANLLEGQTWARLAGEVDGAQDQIQAQMQTLTSVAAGDSASIAALQAWGIDSGWTTLTSIHDAMITGASIAAPDEYGLLRIYADKCTQACLARFKPGEFASGGVLGVNYTDLQNYFASLLALQVQGMTLLANALNSSGENDLLQKQLGLFQANLATQCEEFLWSVESYTVACCGGASLLDLFRASASDCDPVLQADAFVGVYVYPAETPFAASPAQAFRTRVWGGTSSDGSLDTKTFVALQTAPPGTTVGREDGSALALALAPAGGGDALAATAALHVVFTPDGNKQWSLFRHTFTNPPAAAYGLAAPLSVPNAWFTTLIDSLSPNAATAGSTISLPSPLDYDFSAVPAGSFYPVLTGRTMFVGNGSGSQKIGEKYNFTRGPFTLEGWVRPSAPGGAVVSVILLGTQPFAGNTNACFRINLVHWGVNANLEVMSADGGYYNENTTASQQSILGDGEWHHVAAVLEKNGAITIYLDGNPLAAQRHSGTESPGGGESGLSPEYGSDWDWISGYVLIGGPDMYAEGPNFDTTWPSIHGSLSEVRIWNVARQQSDIQGYMRRRATGGEPGLLAAWSLDTGTVTNRVDSTRSSVASHFSFALMSSDWLALPAGQTWATAG